MKKLAFVALAAALVSPVFAAEQAGTAVPSAETNATAPAGTAPQASKPNGSSRQIASAKKHRHHKHKKSHSASSASDMSGTPSGASAGTVQ